MGMTIFPMDCEDGKIFGAPCLSLCGVDGCSHSNETKQGSNAAGDFKAQMSAVSGE